MTRITLTAVLIILLNVLVGCYSVDSGKSQLLPARLKTVPEAVVAAKAAESSETDIVEEMVMNRWSYREALESLIAYYEGMGNNMKLRWAKDELKRLDRMPQYNYIIEAGLAGPNLKAVGSIALADYMYEDALRAEKWAGMLILIKHEDMLRSTLDKYNQLIREHPSSDKIDDAAFRAAGICEYFKDYTIALLYYNRTYQWDPETVHPARFKAAYILDEYLHRREEALGLYQQAIEKENLREEDRKFAEKRVERLTKSGESLEENK